MLCFIYDLYIFYLFNLFVYLYRRSCIRKYYKYNDRRAQAFKPINIILSEVSFSFSFSSEMHNLTGCVESKLYCQGTDRHIDVWNVQKFLLTIAIRRLHNPICAYMHIVHTYYCIIHTRST